MIEAGYCIHEIFAQQAAQHPNAIAAVSGDRALTYDELNRRANQLAHNLRDRGVGPEELVGVCVERSLEMVVALLGILKAGGAYVPLDPAYPGERLALLLADAGVRIVLTQAALSHKFFDHNVELLLLDKDSQALAAAAEENPENLCTPENLAYVMYTSGSTGIPKGVSIPHRAVVRLVKETNYAHFDREQVFLQFAPLSFDASTFEIWGSLLNGARLAVMPPGSASLAELGTALRRYGVTTLWLTAGLFHQMVEEELENLGGLRQLLAGGDVLSPAHVARVAHELNHCQLINGYGPTENTTFTCCYAVAADEKFAGTVPIGFPIANTQVFILDEALQPVPDGQPGELYIAGAGLARGYLNHPALTAERFVPHPFSSAPGARLYRSGDSARRLADGRIDFLGRLDQQVKIRGYRIELGEIEAVLRKHSSVRDVAVVAGQGKLIAYIVPSAKPIETGRLWTDLRDFIRSKLPEYMLPAIFIELPALPLTTSGKVDRRALPAPDETRPDLEQVYVAPRTEAETTMARIWSELLGLEQIGVYDNFFELGGHSMLATQVVSRVFDTFHVRLSLRSFFDSPTVAALAALVAGAAKENVEATPSIRRLQRGEPPISPT